MPFPHRYIKLTDEERKQTVNALKTYLREDKIKKRTRLQVIYLSGQGWTFRAIIEHSKLSYATVRRWIYRWQKDGLKPFLPGKK